MAKTVGVWWDLEGHCLLTAIKYFSKTVEEEKSSETISE